MKWYLQLRHDFPTRGPNPDEFVGPFDSYHAAAAHQQHFGPMAATIEQYNPANEHLVEVYTPLDHIEYLKGRD